MPLLFALVALAGFIYFFPKTNCNQGRGTFLSCTMPEDSIAIIDQPARIIIGGRGNFVVEQRNANGDVIFHESINNSGNYSIGLATDQPTTISMVKASNWINTPGITIASYDNILYPSLEVYVPHEKILGQLFKGSGGFVPLIYLFCFCLGLFCAIRNWNR